MIVEIGIRPSGIVALRKESVDRNHVVCVDLIADKASLSARRAWIEIIVSKSN